MALALLAGLVAVGSGKLIAQRRGYCVSTGDFYDSGNMTVLEKKSDHWYRVRGSDGREYNFCVDPTGSFGWQKGTVIEFAHYEMRNGCADFSSPLAKVKAH